jgi:cysteinyl-tRNA synthetase
LLRDRENDIHTCMIKPLSIYNSLTRRKEDFKPLSDLSVNMYTCGPTVYDTAHIGNFRTYTTSDVVNRVLRVNGYQVKFVMNITDVGHLSGDNSGDADIGDDRLQKAAMEKGKTAWEIAEHYAEEFFNDYRKLNLIQPELFSKATEHIKEQISLVQVLEAKGFTYKITDGIYFDTKEYEKKTGSKYGVLSDLDKIKEGARVEPNLEKRNPRDFALWKFSEVPGERHMEWESPWGIGFPGWHIECSAMSMKYLGETIDIHIGGEDIKQIHHTNEIAQSEAATGKKFVNYWIHGAFLKVDGGRMGKSLGNAFTLADIEAKGYDPLALRYFYLGGHYRDQINFTWEALESAQNALNNLKSTLRSMLEKREHERTRLSDEKLEKIDVYNERFVNALNDDINTPQALAVMWEMVKSNIPTPDKVDMLYNFDEVLGLKLREVTPSTNKELPQEIKRLMQQREDLRREGKFDEADKLRELIEQKGFDVKDTKIDA